MFRPLAINVPNFTPFLHTVLGVLKLDQAKFTINFVVTIIQKAIIWTNGGAIGF